METKSVLYDAILSFYKNGQINEQGLDKALSLDWITFEEKEKIILECENK